MAAIMRFFIGKFQAFDQWRANCPMWINFFAVGADELRAIRE